MELLTNLCIALGWLLLAQTSVPAGQPDPRAAARDGSGRASSASGGAASGAPQEEPLRAIEGRFPWFIILNSPQDLDELWRKIERPDLVLLRSDRLAGPARGVVGAGKGLEASRSLVKSVKITGRVVGENADLGVELVIAASGAESVWAPIRLDNQRVIAAREGARDVSVRAVDRGQWQVNLTGPGEHRIRVDLRAQISTELARRKLSLAIPEAASTQLELHFARPQSDVLIGTDEDFGLTELGEGKGALLAAHLSPRSKVEVSWSDDADSGGQPAPLLTAQGEIAIDIDAQQMRTRSSWAIRCMRGIAKSLELQVDDADEITELEIDDQSLEDDIAQARGPGKLTISLDDPIRAGSSRRLVLRTRRSLAKAGGQRISFAGFPLANAREQSGYIGITRSPSLYIGAPAPQGVYRIDASKLPADLRARPSTSLAFEFPAQPFSLNLLVEPSPPQIRGELRTLLQIESDQVRSETAIDLSWVRGDLFEVEIGVAPGLQVLSVGPAESVESTNLTDATANFGGLEASQQARRLTVRLTPQARDRSKVALKLSAIEPIKALGSIKLSVFWLGQAAATSSLYAIHVGRGLSLDLDDETGRLRRSPEISSRFENPQADTLAGIVARAVIGAPLFLTDDGSSRFIPVRITRLERRLHHEASLYATVSPFAVDVLERLAISVRHGSVSSLEIRVPAELADRWELVDRQEVQSQELDRDPDGSRRYRLSFARAIGDLGTLRFRYRLSLNPVLDSATAREVTIPRITIKEGEAGPTRVLMDFTPEIVVLDSAPGWVRGSDELTVEPALDGPSIRFTERDPRGPTTPFSFKARALEKVSLPSLVIPRLLIKTIRGSGGVAQTTVRYWVESHGADFPFSLPEGLEWIEARVDGRIADRVDFDKSRSEYRLRFPADALSRPALVELELEEVAPGSGVSWRLPELKGGGVVLQALWEVRLPWSAALVGIPRGWSDENQWLWTGLSWKRGSGKESAGLNEWLLGAGAAASATDDFAGSSADNSDRYLFSRRGQPTALHAWIVPRSWLIGVCSGLTLVIGFLAIFLRLRFRIIWLAVALVATLAAVLVEPAVTFLALQAAALGAMLTLLGLVIERAIERTSRHLSRVERGAAAAVRAVTDSSLNRSATVGSDDSTAIRVRVPSTLDHAPAATLAPEAREEARSSTLGRA